MRDQLPLAACRLTVVYTGQATVTFPDFESNTESKLINAWTSFLRDHVRRLLHLSRVLTNAERSSIGNDNDILLTNDKDETPMDVASLPSSGTALRSSFFHLYRSHRHNGAPGATNTNDAPVQVLTAPHTSATTNTHCLPVRHDSSAPYFA
jgi:hypothetical protein